MYFETTASVTMLSEMICQLLRRTSPLTDPKISILFKHYGERVFWFSKSLFVCIRQHLLTTSSTMDRCPSTSSPSADTSVMENLYTSPVLSATKTVPSSLVKQTAVPRRATTLRKKADGLRIYFL